MSQSLDIDLLRSFVAIAETGVLGQAALRVGRTQSALSMQMQRLEGIVEQPLLHRTGRGVTLTATGERLLVRAVELLRKHDEALAELRGEQLSGVLRFSCPDDYAVVFLPYLLQSFASLHPRVQLEVMCAPTPRLHELLARHAVDLALVSVPGGAAGDNVIRREPLVWVAHRDGAAASLDPLPLALGAPDALDHRLPRQALEAAGRAYRLAYASSSLSGLVGMARSGQAVIVLTRTAVPDDLQILTPDQGFPELPSVGVTLAFDREAPTALTAAFAAHVRKFLPAA
ncbi:MULTISPECIES: LysR family transcriptional regulator [Variovorax]|uniref:LysR family transcriptional regulator n=1 Tax=Variovorax TaxID=34072 RepID=UPI002785234E|nr:MULTISPECIES: LysR family transcriptional regulator [Variovorax]MDQ0042669.1 DNA-binding transcriptional LysR family regulator [Variovorax boronicumulans]MDQ0606633.1 DNA-binding transcriptional LysR family regulator [Variovorax sp. W1I1]